MRPSPWPSPWDLRLAGRTAALSLVTAVVVFLIEAITDERGVAAAGTGGRSIGVLPLMPVACAAAVILSLAPLSASGELRAMAALGSSPWRARAPAIAVAIAITVLSAVGLTRRPSDVAALFPPAVPAGDVRVEQHPTEGVVFVAARRKIRVRTTDEGELLERTGPPEAPDAGSTPDRAQVFGASLAIALAGIALSVWAAAPSRRGVIRTLLTLTAWGVSEVLAFQAAGARTVPAWTTALPSCALLLVVLVQDRAARRLRRDEAWI